MTADYNYMDCVVCGGPAGFDHKCPDIAEKRIEAGRKSHDERVNYSVWYGTRLYDGFRAFNGDYNHDN